MNDDPNFPIGQKSSMNINIQDTWIPMSDGARLGARIWKPDQDDLRALPAILEYIPYRKDDFTALRDSTTIAWFAEQGYVSVRVDMRGAGSSDGVLYDEYSEVEINDGLEVIDWLAKQPWCDGNVGTIGISWGGVTGLQLASRNPEALKTVIAVGATEHRYYDDAGYYMGCMIGQTIGWAAIMFGYNTRPPDPALVGDQWRELWLKRIRTAPHYLIRWLEHQREDSYWLRGSVGIDYSAVKVPIYAVSGHADCWPNTVSRLLQNLQCEMRGLQGAWCHRYPHLGIPGPQVGFLQDAKRWFDHWLKGEDTGITQEDPYQVYLQYSVRPKKFYDFRPGRWVSEPEWPSPFVKCERFFLGNGRISTTPSEVAEFEVNSPQTVGLESGEYMPWFAFGVADELPGDQQVEDKGSLCFDTDELEQPLEILGNPQLVVALTCDKPAALLAVRLCDVWPDGASTLITRGLLNLCYRDAKNEPQDLIPGERYTVRINLNHTGYVVPVGHKLRVAISTSYWPMAWPTPQPATIVILAGSSHLNLPLRQIGAREQRLTSFEEPVVRDELPTTQLREFEQERKFVENPETHECQLKIYADNGKVRFGDNAVEMGSRCWQTYTIKSNDPLSAHAEYEWEWEFGRGDAWQIKTLTRTELYSDAENFYLESEVTAWEHEIQIYNRTESQRFKRDHF